VLRFWNVDFVENIGGVVEQILVELRAIPHPNPAPQREREARSTMRVLITRPREDAEALAAILRAEGVEPVVAPLLAIRAAADGALDLAGVQALLFTSANGVRAFARRTAVRALPVFAVGDATARAAKDAGFARVESAAGAVNDLAALVRARLDPARGALLHGAGADVAGDLAGVLGAWGFAVRRVVLYRAAKARRLPEAVTRPLAEGALDGVLFFSPRTAATFVSLARQAGVVPSLARLDALCLSEAVAAAVREVAWRAVAVAIRPDQPALLQLVRDAAAARRG
jgi:uroporphyrinogen-III synthase